MRLQDLIPLAFEVASKDVVTGEWLRTWATVVGAIAASAAVVLALYRDTFREWRRRPKISLSFDGPPQDAISVLVDYQPEPGRRVLSHWLRLGVSNSTSRRTASEVRVLVTSLYRLERGKEVRQPLDTVALIWSNLPEPTDAVELPPGMRRRVDVAALRWPSDQIPARDDIGSWAELQVIPTPSSSRNHLVPGYYKLELVVTAKDVDATSYSVRLRVDGRWAPDDAVWERFNLEGLERLR